MATFYPHFRLANQMGGHEFTWPAQTVGELLEIGLQQFGKMFKDELSNATVLVNGRAISYLGGRRTPLTDNDEVWTILPSAGG